MPGGFFGYGRGSGVIPGVRSSPQGSTDSVVKGIMAGIRGPQMRAARSAAIGEGIRRFESIGTEESMRIAQLMGENPQGAAMYADTFGGWEKLYNQQKSNALQQRAVKAGSSLQESPDAVPWAPGMQPGAGSPDSPQDYYRALIEAGFSPTEAAQMVQPMLEMYKTQSETAENLRPAKPSYQRDANGYLYDMATGERAFPSVEKINKGMKIYGPDGNLMVDTGGGGMVNPNQALHNKTVSEVQRRTMANSMAMDRMAEIEGSYEDRFLTWPTQLEAAYYRVKEKAGVDLDPEEEKLVGDYDEFRVGVLDNLNLYIKDITGAQMSEKEADRIEKAVINMKKSPTEFKRGIRRVMKQLRRRDRMYRYMLNHGFIQEGHDFNQGAPPISEYAFKKLREKRLDVILKDIKSRPVPPGVQAPSEKELQLMAVEQYDEDQMSGVVWDG